MKNHGRRTGLLALASALGVLLCLPGSALAAHDLRIYKVEKQVDLNSDYNEDYVECIDGDYALDGMWRIDHVDYDEDMAFSDLMTTTDVLKAERDAVDVGRYNFAFTKNALGRTQLKLFATCLGVTTEQESSHTHAFVVSGVKAASAADLAAATNINNVDVTIDDFAVDADTTQAGNQACGSGEVVIAPGWHVSRNGGGDVADQWGRITGSTLFGAQVLPKGTANRNSWQWRFRVNNHVGDNVDLSVSAYCLRIKVVSPGSGGNTSKHKLIVKRNKDVLNTSLPGNAITEKQLTCGDHYKALVAGWWLDNPDFTWYMGMDPRPKTRAYRFLNSHGASETVDLAALCFNYRTT
jgi:hypothetical protein